MKSSPSEPGSNRKGGAKLAVLQQRFPQGFDYAGDSAADLPLWKCARRSLVVDAAPRLRRAAGGAHLERVFSTPMKPLWSRLRSALRIHQVGQESVDLRAGDHGAPRFGPAFHGVGGRSGLRGFLPVRVLRLYIQRYARSGSRPAGMTFEAPAPVRRRNAALDGRFRLDSLPGAGGRYDRRVIAARRVHRRPGVVLHSNSGVLALSQAKAAAGCLCPFRAVHHPHCGRPYRHRDRLFGLAALLRHFLLHQHGVH